jgi:hypothetical protein
MERGETKDWELADTDEFIQEFLQKGQVIHAYGGYVAAEHKDDMGTYHVIHPIAFLAPDLGAAILIARNAAREKFPVNDGWIRHSCDAVEVPGITIVWGDKNG